MDTVLETLFHAFPQGPAVGPIAFLNARYHPALEELKNGPLFLQQHFKPYAAELEQQGFEISRDILDGSPATVLVLMPKNTVEAACLAAQGVTLLAEGGVLVCAADNKAGGARLKKILQGFGLKEVHDLSKNKARAAWGIKLGIFTDAVEKAVEAGGLQPVQGGDFVSMPGLFSWDRVDKGSEILTQNLPATLKGRGADFGCGYGFLSRDILENAQGIESLYCIDADARAVEICGMNLKNFSHVHCLWEDLTQPVPGVTDLDWIVMNPPFHAGKITDASIGQAFIHTAASSLRQGGELWMVANVGLPYEEILRQEFSRCRNMYEEEGFKVFHAVK